MLNEICVDGEWVTYDFMGDDSERSLQFYEQINASIFASGSYPIRYNGVLQSPTPENTKFYKSSDPNYQKNKRVNELFLQELCF